MYKSDNMGMCPIMKSWISYTAQTLCNELNICVPPNSNVEILIPNVVVLGGGVFVR